MDTENPGAAQAQAVAAPPNDRPDHRRRGLPGPAGSCTLASWPFSPRHWGPCNSSTSTSEMPSMPTWGWLSPASSSSTCYSVVTGLLGCSRSSCVFAHGSSASYVSRRRMRSSPSSRSMSWFPGSSTGTGELLCSSPPTAIREVAPGLVCRARRVPGRPRVAPLARLPRSTIR